MKMKLLLVLHHQRGFHPSHSHHPHPHLLRSLHLLLLLFLHFQKGFTLDCNLEANKCDWRWTNFVKASSLNGSSSSSSSMASEFLLFKPEDVNKEDLVLATLTSPEVNENQSWSKGCSLEFSSNMGHLENASIKVVIKRTSGNVIIPTEIRGTNEQKWEKHSTPIGNLVRPFHIEIIVHRKEGKKLSPLSYLAIGRIQLSHCLTDSTATTEGNMACEMTCQSNQKCIQRHQVCDWYWDCPDGEDERFDCNQLPQSAYCSFSSGTIEDCGWRNQGQNLWTIENGHAGANFKTGSFVASADMHSSSFPPPIYLSWDSKSPYFGTCEVRFSFYLGAQRSSLKVDIIESDEKRLYPDTAVPIFREFLKSTSKEHSMWRRKRVKIPTEIKTSFSVIISATKGIGSALRPPYKRAGFANFSLSKECFGIGMVIDQTTILPPTTTTNGKHIGMVVPNSGFLFTSCNAMGNEVPKTEDCQKAYNGSPSVEVSDEKESPHVGLQKWTVPATGAYSVFAKGADGATGLGYNATGGKGDLIRAVFFWYKNEVIFIVVGQTPFNACRADVTHNCGLVSSLSQGESLNTGDNRATGGGGGGATFLMQKKGDRLEPLLIAAGGGGGGSNKSASGGKARGLISPYIVTDFGKGRGGSWNNSRIELSQGQSLVNGASGGKCGRSLDGFGGFGGGGGSCGGNGGGGGGYIGGRAGKDQNGGEGGSSYVHPTYGSLAHVFFDFDFGPSGFVRILPQKEKCCNGETACVIIGQVIGEGKERTDLETCICSHSYFPEWCTKEAGSYFIILVLCVAAGLLVIFLSIFIFCTTYKNKIRNNGQVRDVACVRGDASTSQLISNSSTDVQLSRLRSGHNIVTEYNPNYEFGGSTCALQDLKEIPRDKLTLVKALGQGAFGEVYQGYLSNMPGEITNELPVAVKTLPEFSANHQAEMDFMTEALIMSKFKDRNIVRFIGVCFEKMPRFIVLELLPGGDLKTFLRESRGTQSKPSPLNMGDLMVIALDVARGCKYLEESHFIHRDIAARNCLLTSKFKSPNANNVITPDGVFNMNDYNNGYNNSGIIVKIADFGMARDIYRADYYRKGGKAMLPVKWMPPEAFLDGIFTSKTDVWSFGVLLWEVMSMGFMPYPGRGNQEVMQLVTAGGRLEPPNSSTPPQVYAIMKQCWLAAPERRPSFSTIIERIGYCLVDPDVVTTKLPTFQKTSLTERDTTVMRPPPDATDYLIPNNPCSNSNYSMSTEKSELLSPDTCSTMTNEETGKLVELEDPLPPNVPPRPGNWNDAKRSADRNNVPKKEMNGNINANTTNDESQNKTVSQAMISENVHHGNQQNVNRYVNVDVNENV